MAKVSDFGISKLAPVSDGKGVTMDQISTAVRGTPVSSTASILEKDLWHNESVLWRTWFFEVKILLLLVSALRIINSLRKLNPLFFLFVFIVA